VFALWAANDGPLSLRRLAAVCLSVCPKRLNKRIALRFKNLRAVYFCTCCAVLCYKLSCGEMESGSEQCIRGQTAELCCGWLYPQRHIAVPVWISCSADVLVSLTCVVLVQLTCIVGVCCITFHYFCLLAALWGSPVCDTALGVSG
jgi:hypothetical protein